MFWVNLAMSIFLPCYTHDFVPGVSVHVSIDIQYSCSLIRT